MLVLYVLVLLLIVYLSYKTSNGDYFNLNFIFLVGYLISAFCCIYNSSLWNVSIHLITLFIIVTGQIAFSLGTSLGNKTVTKTINNNSRQYKLYDIINDGSSNIKLVIIIIFDLVIVFLLYRDIVRIANANLVSWGNLFYNFRSNLGDDSLGARYSSVVNIGIRLTRSLAYIYLTIFIGNIFNPENRRKRKGLIRYLIPVIIYSIQVMLQGYRIQLIAMVVATLFLSFYFFQTNMGWSGRVNFAVIRKLLIIFFLICVGFYYSKFLIGKLQESNGVVYYVTNYLGGSLQLFDMYLQKPINNGHETFAAMVDSLRGAFGLFKNTATVIQHEYRSAITGIYIGNVYTGFRNYYNDFGIIGTVVLSFLLGYIFSHWYKRIKVRQKWTVYNLFELMFYASLLYTIVFHFFTDYFYALIGLGWIFNAFLFWLLTILIFGTKISFGGRKL